MEEHLPHWLNKQAELSPHRTAVELEDGEVVTFLDLKKRGKEAAYKLVGLGVGKRSKVAILSENNLDMIVTIHALSYLQAIIVFLNTKLTKKELEEQLSESNSMLLLSTETMKQKKKLGFSVQFTFTEIQKLPERQIVLEEKINLEAPFTMMFTSGTTGKPKMVVHTYGNHWWSAIGSTLNLGLHENDKWLLTLPIYHVGGLSILLRSAITGMEVYLIEKYDVERLYHALQEKHITIASIVTLMLKELLDRLNGEQLSTKVRCLLLGGGAVPEPMLEQVKKKGLPLFQSYGMTETSSQIVTLSMEDTLKKIGSSGKSLFPAQMKIADQNEEGIGEIVLKGPMVFHGYENNPEANKKSFSDGWFKTGDLGYTDSDGFLFVVDRRTDLIISGGENIYPREIENVLLELDGIKETAVVAKPDSKWGQAPVAFVVNSDEHLSASEVIKFLELKLASYKVPKYIYFVNDLPRNATNKIMRHELKKQL